MPKPICAFAGGAAGTLGNGTYCQIIGSVFIPTGSTQNGCEPLDLATYMISLNSGVTAGTATFQAVFNDKTTWVALVTPAPVPLVFATQAIYNGIINGPFLGLRIVVTGLTGGTIQLIQLISGVRSL